MEEAPQPDKSMLPPQHEQKGKFAYILYRILTEGNYKSLHWSDDGTEVVIESPNAVAEEVLAHHFDTNKFLSFTRQLHLYGFRRITDGRKVRQLKGFCKWRHPNFKCGHPHLLDKMYRYQVPRHPSGAHGLVMSRNLPKNMRKRTALKAEPSGTTAPFSPNTVSTFGGCENPPFPAAEKHDSQHSSATEMKVASASDAINALQMLVDIVDSLDPDVLAFVRGQLDIVGEAIDKVLADSTACDMGTLSVSSPRSVRVAQPTSPPQKQKQQQIIYAANTKLNVMMGDSSIHASQGVHSSMPSAYPTPIAARPSLLPRALTAVYPSMSAQFPVISTPDTLSHLMTSQDFMAQHQQRVAINEASPIANISGNTSPYATMAPMVAAMPPTANADGYALGHPAAADVRQLGTFEAQLFATAPTTPFIITCNPMANGVAIAAQTPMQMNTPASWVAGEPTGTSEISVAACTSPPGIVQSNAHVSR